MRLWLDKLFKLKLLPKEGVLPPYPVKTIISNPTPLPSAIDLVHCATQPLVQLHEDWNNEGSYLITSFSG